MNIHEVLEQKGKQIETVRPVRRLEEIVALFAARNISSVVVVNADDRPLGIVTDRIVIAALARHGRETLNLSAADVMQSPAPACETGDSLQSAMQMMTARRVRHLLVQRGGEMAGVVSIGDLVKARIRDAELENNVLRDLTAAHMTAA